ncbi:MAG: helix-turn-helix transcriptional regulator [Nevskiaceae bacterium]
MIARSIDQHSMAVSIEIARAAGHGRWDFYQFGKDTFIVAGDSLFDQACVEHVPGEDLVEFHLRLSGTMHLRDPDCAESLVVKPNSLLVLRQPAGAEIQDRVEGGKRDTFVSLYCRPESLAALATRNGVAVPAALRFAIGVRADPVRQLLLPLDPGLLLIAHSLLHSPFVGGLRLLYAQTKATELLCEILHGPVHSTPGPRPVSNDDLRRLDLARQIIVTQHSPPPLINEIARRVGVSETKLKRAFKARFGTTIFDMSLQTRMRHALELLRCKRMPVSRVALSVGYSHQTSFASAFKKPDRSLPSAARPAPGGVGTAPPLSAFNPATRTQIASALRIDAVGAQPSLERRELLPVALPKIH